MENHATGSFRTNDLLKSESNHAVSDISKSSIEIETENACGGEGRQSGDVLGPAVYEKDENGYSIMATSIVKLSQRIPCSSNALKKACHSSKIADGREMRQEVKSGKLLITPLSASSGRNQQRPQGSTGCRILQLDHTCLAPFDSAHRE